MVIEMEDAMFEELEDIVKGLFRDKPIRELRIWTLDPDGEIENSGKKHE